MKGLKKESVEDETTHVDGSGAENLSDEQQSNAESE